MKKFCSITVLILLCNYVFAQQTTNLKGIVVDTDLKGNIKPIQGAYIRWMSDKNFVESDSNGVFIIPIVNETKYLIVSYVGYKTDTIFVAEKKFVKVLLITKNRLKDVNINVDRKGSEISFIDPWKTTIMNEKELFKAACCNLSESFETNPSVDVNLTDAITGTKQIQMLGLASQYTQLTQEMIPGARGLAVNYGSAYTPGTWINSIQVTKGIGSVVNGFESVAGQINTELHKSDVKETVYFNAYAGEGGRYEANLNYAHKTSTAFSHMILLHASAITSRMDNNQDGYLDNPLGYQLNAMYRFRYDKNKGLIIQGGIRTLVDSKTGGQFNFEANADTINKPRLYGIQIKAFRNEGFLKVGYVFNKKIYKSMGLQLSGAKQKYESFFGENIYNGTQNSFYSNLIYQSLISSSDHKFKTGLSLMVDNYDERLYNFSNYLFKRNEVVSGAFFEYTYSFLTKFTLVAGQRLDYNSIYGLFYTPRLHMRYALNKTLVLRASGGRGQRTANIVAENAGLLVSARQFIFATNNQTNAYGMMPEVAWNYGLSLTQNFKLNYRKGSWTIDYYYTHFQNQIVVDRDANTRQVKFYNLNGTSFSNSLQVQLDYELIRRLDMRMAYRFYNVQTQYETIGLKEVPLIAAHRAFFNVSYTTKNKWNFDVTWQWIGEKRFPSTQANPIVNRLSNYSQAFTLLNSQISKSMFNKKFDTYIGVENMLDFKQINPIIDAQNPFGSYFDASMVWGPVFGRMIYSGLRLKF
jgi:outer membrane receptor for ferrienterochelin and colicins